MASECSISFSQQRAASATCTCAQRNLFWLFSFGAQLRRQLNSICSHQLLLLHSLALSACHATLCRLCLLLLYLLPLRFLLLLPLLPVPFLISTFILVAYIPCYCYCFCYDYFGLVRGVQFHTSQVRSVHGSAALAFVYLLYDIRMYVRVHVNMNF